MYSSLPSFSDSVGSLTYDSFSKKWDTNQTNAIRYVQTIISVPIIKRRRREGLTIFWALVVFLVIYAINQNIEPLPMVTDDDLAQTQHVQNTTTVAEPIQNYSIPRNIWQIFFAPAGLGDDTNIDPAKLADTPSWLAKNPDYQYTLVGSKGANEFVRKHFSESRDLYRTYRALKNPGLKSDMLRYMMLSVLGGVYTDTDTLCYRSIDYWIPKQYRGRTRVIVGIEFDILDGPSWADISHDVQFCQWTIAAAPGHPLFTRMLDRATGSLKDLVREHNTTLPELKASSFEVMNSTGPAAWTDAVFEQLQLADPELKELRDLSGMTEPRLIGDILVLPIDGFGMGQPHSNSTNDGTIPDSALVRHNFRGSWRD